MAKTPRISRIYTNERHRTYSCGFVLFVAWSLDASLGLLGGSQLLHDPLLLWLSVLAEVNKQAEFEVRGSQVVQHLRSKCVVEGEHDVASQVPSLRLV